MTDDYKLGYENGRFAVLNELRTELSKHREPLLRKVEDASIINVEFGELDAFDAVEAWQVNKMEELSDD